MDIQVFSLYAVERNKKKRFPFNKINVTLLKKLRTRDINLTFGIWEMCFRTATFNLYPTFCFAFKKKG